MSYKELYVLKYFLLLFFPILLSANLTFAVNHNKELALLESLDIESSFIYDDEMNNMITNNSTNERRSFYFKTMSEAHLFIPAIKSILAEYKVPKEFLYLAMVESNFSNRVHSDKSASGLWQFMPQTAGKYKLKIDDYVDERRDIFKSTKAAAKYLSSLHKIFGKWYLAAIAYNCGSGKLVDAIKEAGTDDLTVLLDEDKKYISKESRDFMRKIIALAIIGRDENFLLDGKNEHLLNRAIANPISTVKLASGESLHRVSKMLGMPIEDLQKLNRHLKHDFTPPNRGEYDIYIPYMKLSDFKQRYKKQPVQYTYKVYTVVKGDNLSYLCQKYNVSPKTLLDLNKLKNARLKPKQKILIPVMKNQETLSAKKTPATNTTNYYQVKKGDSLESISKACKISVQNLKLKNNLHSNMLKIGARLKLHE